MISEEFEQLWEKLLSSYLSFSSMITLKYCPFIFVHDKNIIYSYVTAKLEAFNYLNAH